MDKETPGLSCRQLSGFTGEKMYELNFNAVEVPAANVLGEVDKGWPALAKPLNKATAILCAYMVGGCQYTMELTVQYAQTRVQFNQPIGAFQWVQGYIIEQANQLERARRTTLEAIWKLDMQKSEKEQEEAIALAKTVTSEAFLECGHLGMKCTPASEWTRNIRSTSGVKNPRLCIFYLGDPTTIEKDRKVFSSVKNHPPADRGVIYYLRVIASEDVYYYQKAIVQEA